MPGNTTNGRILSCVGEAKSGLYMIRVHEHSVVAKCVFDAAYLPQHIWW